MERPLYLGIDLGTTNSAASVFDGEQLTSVRTTGGETLTPSVVRIDAKGALTVGARARRYLQKDPENTRGEFKRLMGSQNKVTFAASKQVKTPEELAAQVLLSLQKDVEAQLGVRPDQAVIAVPALFELPQIKATSEAARLAGFSRIETIQEPVASALASGWTADDAKGQWLVYDLGGGTFDASLLETQEGLLRVVGHDGDNFLGGRDFDLALVDHLIGKLAQQGIVVERSRPEHASAVAKLKAYAEEAKIELSRVTATTLLIEGLEVGDDTLDDLELALGADELALVTAPLVDRSIRVCERLLKQHGTRKLERVVLVGGPTLMPIVRQRLDQALGAPFGTGLDPMLLVAQGAALFAASAALDARPKAAGKASPSGPKLWLQYPAMTPDTTPFVVGRSLEEASALRAVRLTRKDKEWQSEWLPVESDGTFSGMLSLKRRSSCTFDVEVMLPDGSVTSANPPEISVMHGVAIGEPPLARTIGVALANDHVATYFERGSPLPMRKTVTHRTVQQVSPASDYALRVPVVQGDFPFAHLCRLVGVIEIPGSSLKRALPVNSVIELTLEVDRGGALSVKAFLPDQDLVFDRVEQLIAPAASATQMAQVMEQLQQRAATLRAQGFRSGQTETLKALADFESSMLAVRQDLEAARGGDPDATEKARRTLIDFDGLLGDLEAQNAWPELTDRVYSTYAWASERVAELGSDAERTALTQCMEQVQRALRARAPREIERHLATMRRLASTAGARHIRWWQYQLDHCAGLVESSSDPKRAQALVTKARQAEQRGNRAELERHVRELWQLMPDDSEARELGFDSGVR
jgi:molecular chaperone DnaK